MGFAILAPFLISTTTVPPADTLIGDLIHKVLAPELAITSSVGTTLFTVKFPAAIYGLHVLQGINVSDGNTKNILSPMYSGC